MTETVLPPEIAAPSLRWWATRSALATALPLLVFFGLRPDSFGLIPNSLDPFFYTGYAINFDDVMREIGDRYYFVSRWSSYYPAYLLTKVFGAVDGRLIWRLMLCVAILLSIWHLGRRWKWTIQMEMLVGLVVITMPMFARAFLTDYIEYTIVAYGIVLVIQCLEPRHSRVRSLFIGLMCGAIAVANPVAATICFAPVLGYFALSPKRGRGRIGEAAILALGAVGVVIFGLLLFRLRYGIPNVYRPSIEFARSHQHFHDPLKAPRLDWLGQFTWLYIQPVLLAASRHPPQSRTCLW